jgi:hypothetical protein
VVVTVNFWVAVDPFDGEVNEVGCPRFAGPV